MKGALFYDDYGHHPTEISAVLDSLKEKYPDKKLHVIFQPHRYSRTRDCWNEFINCFTQCDELYLLDIYAAGEMPIESISSAEMSSQINGVPVQYVEGSEPKKIVEQLRAVQRWKDGDVVLTLGAGSVSAIGDLLRESL
ncbi:MAG: cyanophycin synthetase [Bdellovibrionales bacterium]